MKLENQVTSVKISNDLYQQCIRCKSKYVWVFWKVKKTWVLGERKEGQFLLNSIPAYTLSELGEMIPFGYLSAQDVVKISNTEWVVRIDKSKKYYDTEVDARASHLITLLKTGEITVFQINGIIVKSKLVASGQETPDPNDDNLANRTTVKS